MESRFGLKDGVMLILVLAVGASVWLSMVQQDRYWPELKGLRDGVRDLSTQVGQLQRAIESQASSAPPAVPGPSDESVRELSTKLDALTALVRSGALSTPAPGSAAAQSPGAAASAPPGEPWARPGVPVTRPLAWTYNSDPSGRPDFAEGGTLTECYEGAPAKLTPYVYNDVYYSRIVEEVVCEQLAMYDAKTLEYRAWLAEAWQMDPGGLWMRVKIHDRARFSDGKPVTAEDVRYTFMDYVLNPELQSEMFKSEVAVVKDVLVISDKVVEFTFDEPKFNNKTAALRNPILPKHFYSAFTPAQINESTGLLVGSGPYRFERMDPNDQWTQPNPVVLVRNENYWGRRPPVERLRYTFITNNATRLVDFKSGNSDIIRAQPEQYHRESQDPEFAEKYKAIAWTNMRSGYAFVSWNCGERDGRLTPFHDKRVRQAMAHMIDIDRVNRDIYYDLATVATGPFPPSQGDPGIKPVAFDMERAKQLLTEAGWIDRNGNGVLENERGDEFKYEFLYASGSSIGPLLGQYLTDQGAKLGIKVSVKVTDWAAMESARNARDYDSLTMAWSWSNPESDPHQIFHSSQIQNQGDNWGQWNSPAGDALIDKARATVDDAERAKIWHEFNRLVYEEQPYLFLLKIPWIRFVSLRVENVNPYTVGFDRREIYIPKDRQ